MEPVTYYFIDLNSYPNQQLEKATFLLGSIPLLHAAVFQAALSGREDIFTGFLVCLVMGLVAVADFGIGIFYNRIDANPRSDIYLKIPALLSAGWLLWEGVVEFSDHQGAWPYLYITAGAFFAVFGLWGHYLKHPQWIRLTPTGIEVRRSRKMRFRLAWDDVNAIRVEGTLLRILSADEHWYEVDLRRLVSRDQAALVLALDCYATLSGARFENR